VKTIRPGKSVDDAVHKAVAETAKTIRNIDSVYVKDIKAHLKDGKVTSFGVICKVSFVTIVNPLSFA